MSLDRLPRPGGDQPLRLAALVFACLIAIAGAILLTGHHDSRRERTAPLRTPAAPSVVIGTQSPPPTLTAAQLARARASGRRFLASYLPVLYGRRPASTITDTDRRVRAELSAAAQSPRAPRDRRPRVTAFTMHAQSSATVVVIAMVTDSVTKPYQIVFQLSRGGRGWHVTQLANY